MDFTLIPPQYRRLAAWHLAAVLLLVSTITACSNRPEPTQPTPPATPNHPVLNSTPPRRKPSPTLEPSPTPSVTPEPSPQPTSFRTRTVETGDTLLGLAQQYDVPIAAIQLHNEMGESTVLKTGQTITIPAAVDWEDASAHWLLHEVKAGESLIAIAQNYGVPVDRLLEVNKLDNPDRIRLGECLVLPLNGPVASSLPLAETTSPAVATPLGTDEQLVSTAASPFPTAAPTVSATRAAEQEVVPPQDLASWPQEIARLINEVRKDHGLAPFEYDQNLERAAQAHANDCVQRGWCSHTGSDGTNIRTRVIRAGYDGSGWAECWAQTQAPQRAVDIWMDEVPPNDPHRRTLLSDWLSEVGIGVSDAGWGYYIIADFGRP